MWLSGLGASSPPSSLVPSSQSPWRPGQECSFCSLVYSASVQVSGWVGVLQGR